MGIGTLPSLLDIPDKLKPMVDQLDDYRYILLEGGRGGAKSQSVGRFLLYLGDRYPLRIVCGREVQVSINESVYNLLTDIIRTHQLAYEIFSTKLVHRITGTTINFRGFREQGAFNIQGMEGVDILWIDEAQAITKETLDVLIPTIRKDDAKIFFSMNRHLHDDPAYVFCKGRSDCLHISINFYENKHCTQALKREAEECRQKSEADYRHIWLGEPLAVAEDMVFGHDELQTTLKVEHPLITGYGLRIAGFDVARFGDDKCACVAIQQMGALHWAEIHSVTWDHRDLNYTTGRILEEANEIKADRSVIDEDGIGSAPLDMLNKGRGLDSFTGFRNPNLSYEKDKQYGNPRTACVYKVKDLIRKGYLQIRNPMILDELEHAFKYKYDNYQRKILVGKDDMKKKYNVKSPNLADALIMAVSLIGEIHYKQQMEYNRQPAYSKEDNMFAGAGIR